MRAHHRPEPPKIYDAPLLWLPQGGGQLGRRAGVGAEGTVGALGGKPLHLSYGRCKAFVLLRQDGDGASQGGGGGPGADVPVRLVPRAVQPEGHDLYVCGLRGWQTAAQKDGCLQRVRYTGKPFPFPVGHHVEPDGVRLTFDQPLDAKSVGRPVAVQGRPVELPLERRTTARRTGRWPSRTRWGSTRCR